MESAPKKLQKPSEDTIQLELFILKSPSAPMLNSRDFVQRKPKTISNVQVTNATCKLPAVGAQVKRTVQDMNSATLKDVAERNL